MGFWQKIRHCLFDTGKTFGQQGFKGDFCRKIGGFLATFVLDEDSYNEGKIPVLQQKFP